MDFFFDIFSDAVLDSLKMLPFLFGAYLLIEYLEHHSSGKMEKLLASSNRLGPVTGALLGCVPQCGFSVAAANLYSGRVITLGTLVAVFLSTSDEALPILLAHPNSLSTVGALLLFKAVLGLVAGLSIDFISRRLRRGSSFYGENRQLHELCEDCHCEERGILRSAVHHTLQIFLFVLIVTVVLNGAVELIGETRLAALLMSGSVFQPAVAALLGFIPNCAASVLLTNLLLSGTISFGAAMAGLSTSAGVGLLVLFRANRNLKENLMIMALIYGISTVAGMLLQLL